MQREHHHKYVGDILKKLKYAYKFIFILFGYFFDYNPEDNPQYNPGEHKSKDQDEQIEHRKIDAFGVDQPKSQYVLYMFQHSIC